jgi:hypothetical protein
VSDQAAKAAVIHALSPNICSSNPIQPETSCETHARINAEMNSFPRANVTTRSLARANKHFQCNPIHESNPGPPKNENNKTPTKRGEKCFNFL